MDPLNFQGFLIICIWVHRNKIYYSSFNLKIYTIIPFSPKIYSLLLFFTFFIYDSLKCKGITRARVRFDESALVLCVA
jgi:hypothetical protein